MSNAIDFSQLMREEKRKARKKKSSSRSLVLSSDGNKEASSSLIDVETQHKTSQQELPVWTHDMTSLALPRLDVRQHPTKYLVSKNINSIYYIPSFLPEPYPTLLLQWLQSVPDNRDPSHPSGTWNTMTFGKRRVALFDTAPLPSPLQQCCQILSDSGVFASPPNHVLVNEYLPGQGILPHTDGPAYAPQTATLSIGGTHVLFRLTPRLSAEQVGVASNEVEEEVLLEGNASLVVFCGDAYREYCHGIDETMTERTSSICANAKEGTEIERGYRISLTFRHKLMN